MDRNAQNSRSKSSLAPNFSWSIAGQQSTLCSRFRKPEERSLPGLRTEELDRVRPGKKSHPAVKQAVARLIQADSAAYTCPVRFELLSGVKAEPGAGL